MNRFTINLECLVVMADESKVCIKCLETKTLNEFYTRTDGKKRTSCIPCYLANCIGAVKVLAKRKNQFDKLVAINGDSCEICQQPATMIDHNHATGQVRGLLCRACNLGLGKFEENLESMSRSLVYLAAETDYELYWIKNRRYGDKRSARHRAKLNADKPLIEKVDDEEV